MLHRGRVTTFVLICLSTVVSAVFAQEAQTSAPQAVNQEALNKLLDRLAADEQKIEDLERRLQQTTPAPPSTAQPVATADTESKIAPATASSQTVSAPSGADGTGTTELGGLGSGMGAGHDHMGLGVGQLLRINGYFDFNFGAGKDANPLIFPLGAAAHTTFQNGELALMTHSQLSDKLSFMSEIVIGSDPTNEFGLDVERYLLTYHQSKYFELSGGRFHTAIGYYSTAFHHGTWFQTATGRPFMYFFEDSGGLLPVHSVGATMTGLVPGTDKLGLHWIAELSNGRPSDALASGAVQNFYSDRNRKAYNVAVYINPEWLSGLQVGGSMYRDRLYPTGLTPANQTISSIYAVYITPTWEFLNEAVLLKNEMQLGRTYNTPLAYTQLSRKFHEFRPYFRYQYVNSPAGDPVNVYKGLYMGPSVGMRWEASEFLAFKLQGNLLEQSKSTFTTGLDAQMAFTF